MKISLLTLFKFLTSIFHINMILVLPVGMLKKSIKMLKIVYYVYIIKCLLELSILKKETPTRLSDRTF